MNSWIISLPATLAQLPETSTATKYSVGDVLMWGAILIGVVFVGSVVIMLLRRRLKEPPNSAGADAGFSLSDLREMRDRGEITPEEYEKTRAKVIAKVKAYAKDPPKSARGPLNDSDSGVDSGDPK